ncbi:hypothetical protein BDW02DRAFT_506595, partial [Decorospora gaudefroyi]
DTFTATTEAAKEDDLPKGSSFLTAPIPRSLSDPSSTQLDPAQEACELRNLCFHLGLCSDVVGFSEQGDLQLAFDPLPPHWLNMDVEGARTISKTAAKKSSKDKSRSRKQLRRKPKNKISFPASRGKGALKPFTGGRVKRRWITIAWAGVTKGLGISRRWDWYLRSTMDHESYHVRTWTHSS